MHRFSRTALRSASWAASVPVVRFSSATIRPFSSTLTRTPKPQLTSTVSLRLRAYATSDPIATQPRESQDQEETIAQQPDATQPQTNLDETVGINAQTGGQRRSNAGSDPTPSNNIYVGNLYFGVTPDGIREEFERFGEVVNVNMPENERGQPRGFAYVEFTNTEDAARAVEAQHRQIFEGRLMMVNYAHKPRTPRRQRDDTLSAPTRSLYIGNLAREMTDEDLNELFRGLDGVVDVRVAIDRMTGMPKGYAHADFSSVEAATEALSRFQGKAYSGRTLRVDYAAGSKRNQ